MRIPKPLLILFIVFLTPVAAAFFMLNYYDLDQFKTVQNGIFVQPTQLSDYQSGKWQLIYLTDKECNKQCRSKERALEKLHIALGADQPRLLLSSAAINSLPISAPVGSLAIIDPQGWYIMQYPPETNLRLVLKDLRKLLKYSHAK